jgi:hypothetical protein
MQQAVTKALGCQTHRTGTLHDKQRRLIEQENTKIQKTAMSTP